MSNIQLFRLSQTSATPLASRQARLERDLQVRMEANLPSLLGVHFLATEYSTGSRHGGRIDTLGIDENGFPVVIEYKRGSNDNVLTQGLFYLDWLLDHKAQFEKLVGNSGCDFEDSDVDWSAPRLVCVAHTFNKYDLHALTHIKRNIDLIRYSFFDNDILMLNLVNPKGSSAAPTSRKPPTKGHSVNEAPESKIQGETTPCVSLIEGKPEHVQALWLELIEFLLGLGDGEEVSMKETKLYLAFQRIRNFACASPKSNFIRVWTKLNPSTVDLVEGFTRDVTDIGHHGTGNLEIMISTEDDLENAKPLLSAAFEGNGDYIDYEQ